MITWTVTITVENAKKPCIPAPCWGGLMQGILMDKLPMSWQAALHENHVHPFAQWVEVKDAARFVWHLCVYSESLAAQVDCQVAAGTVWHCRHLDVDFLFGEVCRQETSIACYMSGIFLADHAPDRLLLTFRTPTSHKVQGEDAIFPSVELIARSLCRRFLLLDPSCVFEDDTVVTDIISSTRIVRYDLHSAVYALNGTRIYGYVGTLELSIHGPDALRRLAYMLFGFAPYSGVGMKTSLGMGACDVKVLNRYKEINHEHLVFANRQNRPDPQ